MYDELYHHGILGQKWGVRRFQNYDGSLTSKGKQRQLTTARHYEKALNSIDKGVAQETRDYSDNRKAAIKLHEKSDKLIKKTNKLEAAGKNADKVYKKIDKLEASADAYNKKAFEHYKNIERGEQLTEKLIIEAAGKGYAISSKTTMRNVTRGSEYVLNALSVIGALAIGSPIAVTTSSSVLSTKYKVSKPKD